MHWGHQGGAMDSMGVPTSTLPVEQAAPVMARRSVLARGWRLAFVAPAALAALQAGVAFAAPRQGDAPSPGPQGIPPAGIGPDGHAPQAHTASQVDVGQPAVPAPAQIPRAGTRPG